MIPRHYKTKHCIHQCGGQKILSAFKTSNVTLTRQTNLQA